MAYHQSTYSGDEEYNIYCGSDCCKGDHIRFERATFTGSYRNAKFNGFEMITGVIISESYGEKKQQHTFTIQLEDGEKIRIKGRNLYANGVWRKAWEDEEQRKAVLAEKHERGNEARAARDMRREEAELEREMDLRYSGW